MIPNRAPLLKPESTPTKAGRREALHSFVIRGCEKNGIAVGDFYRHFFRRLDGLAPPDVGKECVTHLISHGSETSHHWIEVLVGAFGVSENLLWEMTARDINIGSGMPAPASPLRRWCAACLEHDLECDHGPYERLLWSLNLVKICPHHRTILQSSCPHCHRNDAKFLAAKILPGLCTHCSGWLGSSTGRITEISDDQSKYMLWVAQSFSDLLDAKATATKSGPREMLLALADFHYEGNCAKLARSIHRAKSTVSTWTTGAGAMGWQTLCDASYAFHVPMKDILEGNLDAVQTSVVRTLPFIATDRKVRKRIEQPETGRVQEYLQTLLEGGHPRMLSMTAVGRSLNVEPREIRRLVPPDLYRLASATIKRRLTEYRRWQHEFRWNNINLVLKTIVERSTSTQNQISRRAIFAELNAAGLWPTFSEVPTLWKLLADARRLVEQEREASRPESTPGPNPIVGSEFRMGDSDPYSAR